MLDSIKIAHIISGVPSHDELKSRGWQQLFDNYTGKNTGWSYKEKKGSKYPYLNIFTAEDSKVYLSVRISLPAFIFGSNVSLPNQKEIQQALESLSVYVKEKSGLVFDAQTATVWEVHFTKDYYVGEYAMQQVISKLANMNIPNFKKGKYDETTLYFHSKGVGKEENKPRTICIYDKHKDCISKHFSKNDMQKAEGMLRLEFRYKTTDAVKRLVKKLKLPNRGAQTLLTKEFSAEILAPIENQILLLLEETNVQNRILTLTKAYGKRRTAALIQFLIYQQCFGNEFHKIKFLGFSRSAYYACQKDCRTVGVLNLTDNPKTKIQVSDVP